MSVGDFHASHIRRVNVSFFIFAPELDPDKVSKLLEVTPDKCAKKGDKRYNSKGGVIGTESKGWWQIKSAGRIAHVGNDAKDINVHLETVLNLLVNKSDKIISISEGGERCIDILWESTYLYAGTGPVIDSKNLENIAKLQASLAFDIYQVDE